MSAELAWVRHAIWWRLYPLGFAGAYPPPPTAPAGPQEHRLRRVIAWLDHAIELGTSGIALGPIFSAATHGYDTLDHLHIDPRLGDEHDFHAVVSEAHRRGLRVQLDGVFNHVSHRHPLAQAALRDGPGSQAARWFRASGSPQRTGLATFEGHDALVVLNHDNPEVEEHVVRVMRHWLDRGADAWRLDAAYAVPDAFWARVLPQVRATHPGAWFEAEVLHGDYAAFVRDSTADAVTQYELWKAIWSSVNDRNFHELDWALRRHNTMLATFVPATFVGNHDVTRIATQITDPRHLPHAIVLLANARRNPQHLRRRRVRTARRQRTPGRRRRRHPAQVPRPRASGLAGADQAIYRLHQRLIGLRRRHPWLHQATSTTKQLRNDQYVTRVAHRADSLHVALNLADRPLQPPQLTRVLAADPRTEHSPAQIAPHGWAVLGPALPTRA